MREIKFRAKAVSTNDQDIGKLIYFDLFGSDGTWVSGNMADGRDQTAVIDDETVEQFTGLKDKSGQEIYEGDIVMTSHFDKKGEVIFERGMFKIDGGNHTYLRDYAHTFEVIGNIHENPELLKESR